MLGIHDTIQSKTGALNIWFPSLCVFMLCYCLTRVNCGVILTWCWFEKCEPVCARRSSAPCRSAPFQWPLPAPPPPSACRLYLRSDGTHHSGTRQSQKRRAKTSHPCRVSPCETVLRSSGSVMTPPCSTSGELSGFLDSPQRLEPPCMLGMLRTAMPSRDMLLRSRGLPQHWPKQSKKVKRTFSELKNDSLSLWPQSQDSLSAFCRRQRLSQRWQTQNTKVCSSSWNVKKEMGCFKTQLEERTCPPC